MNVLETGVVMLGPPAEPMELCLGQFVFRDADAVHVAPFRVERGQGE